MFQSTNRSRRHKNQHEEQLPSHEPFFSKSALAGIQKKTEPPFFQAKMTIGAPNDKYEKEADTVANAVISNSPPGHAVQQKDIPKIQRLTTGQEEEKLSTNDARMRKDKEIQEKPEIQRMCSDCEKEKVKSVQKMDMPDKEEEMMQKKGEGAATPAPASIGHQIENSSGKGKQLPAGTLREMNSSFGRNFDNVNIHTDTTASQMNKELSAQAFTHGSDIYFNSGKYNPESSDGKQLLAHELTHVVQQGFAKNGEQDTNSDSHPNSIQRACSTAAQAVGTGGCIPQSGDPLGTTALFKTDCDDVLNAAEQQKIESFADSMTATDKVNVHGFASKDGPTDYNDNLSCARAKKAASILISKGISAAQITTFMHGETSGPANLARSVTLELTAGVSRPVVPQLTPVISSGPAPTTCGDQTFDITWSLSRNASANGGFIMQDVTFIWFVTDCNGILVPNPQASPLRYFEAWRVLPGTTNIDAADGNLDRFFWPNNLPWGGGCTDGFVLITAAAQYHDDVSTASMPAHMIRFNPATFANNLQSSTTDPALSGNVSRTVLHNLSFHWSCCPCSTSPTVIDSHTP